MLPQRAFLKARIEYNSEAIIAKIKEQYLPLPIKIVLIKLEAV